MKIYSLFLKIILVSTESMVVPGIFETIIFFSFEIEFIVDDLPTFGLPRIQILGILASEKITSSFTLEKIIFFN